MEFPVVLGLILSLVVRHWPGQPAAQWVNTWTDRLWVLLAIMFVAGSVLSFYNMTSTVLPNGGYRYSVSRPQPIQYGLIAIYAALLALALVGAGCLIRQATSAASLARAGDAWRSATAGVNFLRLATSLIVALAALTIGLALGGPLTITGEGVSSLWPFVIEVVAGVVFFTALATAWAGVKPSRRQ